jgi:MFS transporter, OFA family, oxalate/formate antiporter
MLDTLSRPAIVSVGRVTREGVVGMSEKTASPSMGWVVALAGLGINLALGVLYTWSVVAATLTKSFKLGADGMPLAGEAAGTFQQISAKATATTPEKIVDAKISAAVLADKAFNWTAIDALVPYAIALLVFGITMAFAGRLQDKYGPRLIASIGGVFVGAGMLLASTNNMGAKAAHMPIIVGFGVLTGMGIGLAYACATPSAVKWFHPSKKGLITGLVVAGFGLASVYTAPLTAWLIGTQGASGMFRILGIGFLVSIVGCAQLLRNPPAGYVAPIPAKVANAPATSKPAAVTEAHKDYTWQEMVKTPQFYLLWLMYACSAFAGLMMVGIVSKVATDLFGVGGKYAIEGFATAKYFGLTLGMGFMFTVALAIGNGLGRPIAGMVSDSIGRVRTMMIVFLAQAVLVGWGVSAASSMPMLLVIGALIGAMYGALLTLFPATTFDFFGMKNGGVNYGIIFTAWGVGGSIGNYIAGFAKTMWGSFVPAYYIAAGLCVLAAVIAVTVKAPAPAHATKPATANA